MAITPALADGGGEPAAAPLPIPQTPGPALPYRQLYQLLKLGVFYLNWLLCYALYLKARQSIALKAQGDSLDLFTNEADVDTKALEWLLR